MSWCRLSERKRPRDAAAPRAFVVPLPLHAGAPLGIVSVPIYIPVCLPDHQRARATPRAPDDSTRRVMDALRRIVRGLSTSARVLPGGSSVSGAQLFVLRQIDAAPGLSIGELAARTLAGQSTVSEVVARLVERRLVARRASALDARQSELTLTASGRRAIAAVEPTTQERLAAHSPSCGPASARRSRARSRGGSPRHIWPTRRPRCCSKRARRRGEN